jgi:hypothetical protein
VQYINTVKYIAASDKPAEFVATNHAYAPKLYLMITSSIASFKQ